MTNATTAHHAAAASQSQRERLHYFDMIKGIAITLVVIGHVLTMCIRGIDRAALFKFVGEVHMPLFFFVSGWMMLRPAGKSMRLGRRALQLLVPMVVMSSLWAWRFKSTGLTSPLSGTIEGLWSGEWKDGYWFTLVLMEITLLYAAIVRPVLNHVRSTWLCSGIIVAEWLALECVTQLVLPAEWVAWSSVGLASQFFPVLAFGALAHRDREAFGRMVHNGNVLTAALLLMVAMIYYVCWYWEFPCVPEQMIRPARVMLHLALAVVAIAAVEPWSRRAFAPGVQPGSHRLAHMWDWIGRQSLAIYLLHYFFLFPMEGIRPILEATNLAIVPLLAVSVVVAACIMAVTLFVNWLINLSPLLAFLMTGKLPKFLTSKH